MNRCGLGLSINPPGHKYRREGYHRLARANTPASVSFRRFCSFFALVCASLAQRNVARQHRREYADSASLRLKTKNHSKIHRWQVRSSFAGAEMCPDKKRPAENTCRIVKGLDAVWAHFCPSKPCLPLSIDGSVKGNGFPFAFHHPPQRPKQQNKMLFLFCCFVDSLTERVEWTFRQAVRSVESLRPFLCFGTNRTRKNRIIWNTRLFTLAR